MEQYERPLKGTLKVSENVIMTIQNLPHRRLKVSQESWKIRILLKI